MRAWRLRCDELGSGRKQRAGTKDLARRVRRSPTSSSSWIRVGYLGSERRYQLYGVQNFEWDPATCSRRNAWVNRDVSSPSCVPVVSYPSDHVYLNGARVDRWTREALEWRDGRSAFHTVIGGQRYNPLFSGTLLDDAGRIHYGTPWGRVRLAPQAGR